MACSREREEVSELDRGGVKRICPVDDPWISDLLLSLFLVSYHTRVLSYYFRTSRASLRVSAINSQKGEYKLTDQLKVNCHWFWLPPTPPLYRLHCLSFSRKLYVHVSQPKLIPVFARTHSYTHTESRRETMSRSCKLANRRDSPKENSASFLFWVRRLFSIFSQESLMAINSVKQERFTCNLPESVKKYRMHVVSG